MRRTVMLASAALVFGACVATQFRDGQFTCEGDGACPPGLLCASDGVCRESPLDAPAEPLETGADVGVLIDSGADVDAGVDAAPDACASATWAVFPDATPLGLALDPGGRLYACGRAGTQGWLAEIDPCDGRVVHETTLAVPGFTYLTQFNALTTAGSDVLIAGNIGAPLGVDGTGVLARYDAVSFSQRDLQTFPGALVSPLTRIYVTSDGATWLEGSQHVFEDAAVGWILRVTDGGVVQANIGKDLNGLIDLGDGTVYVFTDDPSPQVERVDTKPSVRGVVGPALAVGTSPSTFLLLGAAGKLYAAGTTKNGTGSIYGYLGVLDPDGGGWITTTIDPDPTTADPLWGFAMDDTSLFVGINQRADFGNGTPTVYRIDLPLTAASKPIWGVPPFGAAVLAVRDIKVGRDGVFVAGANLDNDGSGGIARCDRSGNCGR